MDEPESWRWVWVGATVFFGLGEMATPGSFFMAPFALGALVAATLAFLDVPVAGEWAAFVGVSVACLFALRPLARKLDRDGASDGIGSRRLIGRSAVVLTSIDREDVGVIRVDHEEWRAESADRSPIDVGTSVLITDVQGTKVIVTNNKEPHQ